MKKITPLIAALTANLHLAGNLAHFKARRRRSYGPATCEESGCGRAISGNKKRCWAHSPENPANQVERAA